MPHSSPFIVKARIATSASIAVLLAACGGSSGTDSSVEAGQIQSKTAASLTTNAYVPKTPATPNNYYVATTGSDSNPGTQSAPFKTIRKASTVAGPNSTVHVAPGTYAGGFSTSSSGNSSGRIYYLSDVKWGAKIIAPDTAASVNAVWVNHGNYVTIDGFDVNGSATTATYRNGIYSDGSEIIYQNNHVHNIGNRNDCTKLGGSGLNADRFRMGVNAGVYNNVVHHIGPTGCGAWYHGIYLSTSGTIKNNIVYGVPGGGIQLWHDATHVDIVNNTAFANGFGIIVGSGEYFNKPANPGDFINVFNNIVIDNKVVGISEQGTTGTNNAYRNNLVWNNKTNWRHRNGTVDTGTINADPQFVNYVAEGGGDYRLKSTSPAIDKGISALAPLTDYLGTARHGEVDIGTYEY